MYECVKQDTCVNEIGNFCEFANSDLCVNVKRDELDLQFRTLLGNPIQDFHKIVENVRRKQIEKLQKKFRWLQHRLYYTKVFM